VLTGHGNTNSNDKLLPCNWLKECSRSSKQSSHWLIEGTAYAVVGWHREEGERMVRSESQSTLWELAGWSAGRSVRYLQKVAGGVERGGRFVGCLYPAISVAVVTSLLPSQTVLNCSGTGISVNSPSLLGTKMFISELLALTISHSSESLLR